MIKLKDVIHYYIGQQSEFKARASGAAFVEQLTHANINLPPEYFQSITPLLRPLSSMTENEIEEYKSLMRFTTDGVHQVGIRVDTAASFHFLISKGFDLFSLIESGQAIDSTKLHKP